MSKPLNDNSPMPFGYHQGVKMINVPAKYLLWLSKQEWIEEWPAVLDYIEDNIDVLEMEVSKHA